jgi:hypothetical protein
MSSNLFTSSSVQRVASNTLLRVPAGKVSLSVVVMNDRSSTVRMAVQPSRSLFLAVGEPVSF